MTDFEHNWIKSVPLTNLLLDESCFSRQTELTSCWAKSETPLPPFDKQTCLWCQWGNAALFQACSCLKKLKSLQSSTPLFIYLVTSPPPPKLYPTFIFSLTSAWGMDRKCHQFCFFLLESSSSLLLTFTHMEVDDTHTRTHTCVHQAYHRD